MTAMLRVAIVDQHGAGWNAGEIYTRMLARSLAATAPAASEPLLVTDRDCDVPIRHVRPESLISRARDATPRLPSSLRPVWRRSVDIADRVAVRINGPHSLRAAVAAGASVAVPLLDLAPTRLPIARVAWIPDFQHVRLPHYFSEAERRGRDGTFRRVAAHAERVMLSSEDARRDFAAFAPRYAHKAFVSPFPSIFAFERPSASGPDVVRKYHLPSKFALIVNQFWMHKNHDVVVDAVARLRANGLEVPLVMVGQPADYRDPENGTLSRLLQQIAQHGLGATVFVLGRVARDELVELLRRAALVVQPSRSEGWSTTVEDAKALGRPLLCSDLPVHREQAPSALGFFGVDDADELATLLATNWPRLSAGPDMQAEQRALDAAAEGARRHGERLWHLCADLHASLRGRARTPTVQK